MDTSAFWSLIAAAKDAAGDDPEARPDALHAQLQALPADDIAAFQRHYDQAIARANRWDLWGAAYLMSGGCSDDGFRYFCDWLISEGKEVYEQALQDPDSLAALPRQDEFELESFGYVALEAYAGQTGAELERDLESALGTPAGEQWDEDDLPDMFPKLATKYAGDIED